MLSTDHEASSVVSTLVLVLLVLMPKPSWIWPLASVVACTA